MADSLLKKATGAVVSVVAPQLATPAVKPGGYFDPRESPQLRSDPEDAKFYRIGFDLVVGTFITWDVVGMAVYVDNMTTNDLEFFITFDRCFGEMAVRNGVFIRTRGFKKITLRRDAAAVGNSDGSLIVSVNPAFMVIRGTP